MRGKSLYDEDHDCTPRGFPVDKHLVIYLKDVEKSVLRSIELSIYILYHLRLLVEALFPVEEH